MMATISDPKQIEPKDVVTVRRKLLVTASEQQELPADGSYHQVPTTPATWTWIQLC